MFSRATAVFLFLAFFLSGVFLVRNVFLGVPPAQERVLWVAKETSKAMLMRPDLPDHIYSDQYWPLAFSLDGSWDVWLAPIGPLLLLAYAKSRRLNPIDYAHEDINLSAATLVRIFNPAKAWRSWDYDQFRDTPSEGILTMILVYGVFNFVCGVTGAFLTAYSIRNQIFLAYALTGAIPVTTLFIASLRRPAIVGAALLSGYLGFSYGLGLELGLTQAAATNLWFFGPIAILSTIILLIRTVRARAVRFRTGSVGKIHY